MDIILWVVQGFLGLAFVFLGFNHATRVDSMKSFPNMQWIAAVPRRLMTFIGSCEMAGGIGLILPMLTGIQPWLTPLAAIGLALIMLFAFVFHLARREYPNLISNTVLFLLASFVAYGRFDLLAF